MSFLPLKPSRLLHICLAAPGCGASSALLGKECGHVSCFEGAVLMRMARMQRRVSGSTALAAQLRAEGRMPLFVVARSAAGHRL
jgi:hypothetical protein